MLVWVCEIATAPRVAPDVIYVYVGTCNHCSCFGSHNDSQLYAPVGKHTSTTKVRTREKFTHKSGSVHAHYAFRTLDAYGKHNEVCIYVMVTR